MSCRVTLGLATCTIIAAGSLAVTAPLQQASSAPRADHALGYYDDHLQRVVVIGGEGDPRDGARDTVWSWSGRGWDLVTSTGPMGRVNASGAFDVTRGAAIVAGGSRKSSDGARWQVVGDAWTGGASWQPTTDITAVDHHSMVAVPNGVLMFGGIPGNRSAAWPVETRLLDKNIFRTVASEGPAPRGRSAMVYDRVRRHVVLFGGVGAPSGPKQEQTFLNDTWTWQDGEWRLAANSGPRGRYAHGMVFDERAGVVLLYSGAGAHKGAPLTDMWQWDGKTWTEIPLTGPTPGYRYQPVMVYDRARNKTVLFGGIGNDTSTWEFDGRQWQRIE